MSCSPKVSIVALALGWLICRPTFSPMLMEVVGQLLECKCTIVSVQILYKSKYYWTSKTQNSLPPLQAEVWSVSLRWCQTKRRSLTPLQLLFRETHGCRSGAEGSSDLINLLRVASHPPPSQGRSKGRETPPVPFCLFFLSFFPF